MTKTISIRGAREHNLKNINVDIPRDKLVVITGLSGSGKSSLAFDTLYAEGQRRYVESLSTYARQFLELMQKPDVDSIEGLSPAISIEQKTTSKNPRSTVGTVTELYDYMRLLFARIGVPHSPETGLPIESQTVSQMVDRILDMPIKSKIMIMAPIARGRKGEFKKELQDLKRQGFQRVKVDGKVYEIDDVPDLNKRTNHDIAAIVDRVVIPDEKTPDVLSRIADSIETTLKLTNSLVWVENVETGVVTTFSSKFACPVSGFTLSEIEPRLFSFNSPHGACSVCDGLGVEIVFDETLVVPNKFLSIRDGAIAPWSEEANSSKRTQTKEYYLQLLDSVVHHFGASASASFSDLPEKVQRTILHGSGDTPITIQYNDGRRNYITNKPFEGVIPNLRRRYQETESDWVREHLGRYQNHQPCSTCHGKRLNDQALCVKINARDISEVAALSIGDALHWFENLDLSAKNQEIAQRILKEINSRLGFLVNVGLDYLNLSRASGTLSGGESQRIRLASQIGSGLTGVLYVLDEPSIGLHQRDNDRLLETLKHLRDIGNTVVVVEHDEDAIKTADFVLDIGPGAGRHGGNIIAQGTPDDIMKNPASITGDYLSGKREITVPTVRRIGNGNKITIKGARANNLKNVTVDFPMGTFTCVTGVSGGGKSSLVIETLYKALSRMFSGSREIPGEHDSLSGLQFIDKIIDIDQSPIGRTPRSNPATYIGCFTPIREWFAALPEAKARGFGPGRVFVQRSWRPLRSM
jgi:excinuclease ABC subunit A